MHQTDAPEVIHAPADAEDQSPTEESFKKTIEAA